MKMDQRCPGEVAALEEETICVIAGVKNIFTM
jgi:hypothetical protein